MKQSIRLFTFYFLLILSLMSCAEKSKENNNDDKIGDINSAIIINADSLKKDVKPSTGLVELKILNDTLSIVCTSPYLYYPFGKFKKIDDLKMNIPATTPKVEIVKGSSIKIYELSFKSSSIKMFYSDENKAFEIVSGMINDKEIGLADSIAVNMTKADFLSRFFNNISDKRKPNVLFVKMISGLEGITHIYEFADDKLKSISLITDIDFSK